MTRMLSSASLCIFAVALATAVAPAVAQAQVPNGRYECWFFRSARAGLNFNLTDGGRYTDVNGNAGTVSIAGAQMTFIGAALNGQHALYKGGNPPTVAIVGPRGNEVSSCQLRK
jgi:hypothetical protein